MIKEALASYVAANRREFPFRQASIGASEIGQCARKLWFLKHGTPQDEGFVDRWGAKERGNLIEVLWTKALRAYLGKGKLRFAGPYQRTFYDVTSPLSATPDGLVDGPEPFLVECKSLDPRARMQLKPEHEAQVMTSMGILNETTTYRPQFAVISYIDASFLDEVGEFEVAYDPQVFGNLQARAQAIMEANDDERLRPEGYIAGAVECEHCRFKSRCSAMRAGAVPGREGKLNEEQLREVRQLARERVSMVNRVEALERSKRAAEQAIKDVLRAAETRRVEAEGLRIVWSSVKGRPSWDWPALRAAAEKAGLDLAPFERTGDPSDRLEVRLK